VVAVHVFAEVLFAHRWSKSLFACLQRLTEDSTSDREMISNRCFYNLTFAVVYEINREIPYDLVFISRILVGIYIVYLHSKRFPTPQIIVLDVCLTFSFCAACARFP
jgi:hypothetical protein